MMRSALSTRQLLMVVPLAFIPLASAQAGLFDFLEPKPTPPSLDSERPAAPDVQPLNSILNKTEVHRHITVLHRIKMDKAVTLDRKSAVLQKDRTLRDGDAVMTQYGIRIFAGSAEGDHKAGEFATLAETKGLSPTEQTALAEIDAHRLDDGWTSTATGTDRLITGRSAAANIELPWKWVRDPKGHLVRYVGP